MTRPEGLVPFNRILNVPFYYERRSSEDEWGDLAENEVTKFYFNKDFFLKLETCFFSLINLHPWGKPQGIISAGAYVDKPGEHGKGRAFDLDGIVWTEGKWSAVVGENPIEQYLGIQAFFMRNYGVVLGYQYNAAHRDHIHVDSSLPLGFRSNSLSIILFIQDALNVFWEAGLKKDGVWGPRTAEKFNSVITISGKYPTASQYNAFLNRVKTISFTLSYWPSTFSNPSQSEDLETRVHRLETEVEELKRNIYGLPIE